MKSKEMDKVREGHLIGEHEKELSEKIDTSQSESEDNEVDIFIKKIFSDDEPSSWKPCDKILLVKKEIDNLVTSFKSFLDSSETDINSVLIESRDLYEESKELVNEMLLLKQEVEEKSITEISNLITTHDAAGKELEKVNFALDIIGDIVICKSTLQIYEKYKSQQSFSGSVDAISDLLEILERGSKGFKQTSMYSRIKATAFTIWENLLLDVLSQWHQLVSWKYEDIGKTSKISILIRLEETFKTFDLIKALDTSKHLSTQLGEFSKFLLEEVLIPIMHKECTIEVDADDVINIIFNNEISPKPSCDQVLSNLKIIFTALGGKLKINNDTCTPLITLVGNAIGSEFSDNLIKDCLIETIPYNIADLVNYNETTEKFEEFETFLTKVKFFKDCSSFSILSYMKDIDVLFAEKSSQHYLASAREIMLKDLSSSMSIGVESVSDEASNVEELSEQDKEALGVLNKVLPKSLFYFPRCMISRTTQELLDLVFAMMEQAVQCPNVVAKRLFITARLIFELYDAVVPYHHENFLNTIPQYVALFHNNCMYLAHNLLTLGDKWLTHMEGRGVDYPVSFVDLVPKLRELGFKHLAIHMQQQRKQILDNIRASDLNSIVVKDVLSENAEQAIRQCLRQLQLLKNVWIGVFPSNVFTNLMSTLVNMFIEELIHRVCTVEDISAEMATQLTEIYSLVVKKAPNMFQNPDVVEDRVQSWVKMQELILVLSGSLKDIEHRWNNGNGTLAQQFKKDELRNLIKALFQNTQFRANLLSKINATQDK